MKTSHYLRKYILCGIVLLLIALLAVSMAGCGKGTLGESELQADVEAYEPFQNLNVDTTEFEIIKRMTTEAEKEDLVYVRIHGSNDDYEAQRNYLMTYNLYNDGWKLENVEPFYNEENPDYTEPLHGVPLIEISEYVDSLDLFEYASETSKAERQRYFPVAGEEETGFLEEEDGTYRLKVTFEYGTYDEIVTIPIVYSFWGDDYGVEYKWYPSIDPLSFERKAVLNDGIIGTWEKKSDKGKLIITAHKNKSCTCETYYNVPFYKDPAKETVSGTLHLTYSISENSGEIIGPYLEWKDENNPYTDTIDLDGYDVGTIETLEFGITSSAWTKVG